MSKRRSRYKTDPISGMQYERGSIMDSMNKLDEDMRREQKEIRKSFGGNVRRRNYDEPEIDWSKTPPWLQGIIAILIIGVLLWAFVPHEILYISIGLIITVAVVGSIYVYRKRGFEPFINLGKTAITSYKQMHEDWEREMQKETDREEKRGNRVSPLSTKLQAKFIRTVGSRCENPNCNITFPLEVHHIIPRSEGGSNKENNLIVLCKNCHGNAQRGAWSKDLLREWISRPRRFGY